MAQNAVSLLSQIKSLEAQLTALKVQVEQLCAQEAQPTHTFADLYGRFPELGDMTAEEIDSVLYRLPDVDEELK